MLCLEHKKHPVTVAAIIMRMALVFKHISTCDTVFIKGERQQEGKAPPFDFTLKTVPVVHICEQPRHMHAVPATWQPDWDARMKQLGSVLTTSRFLVRQAARQGVRRHASHLELEAAYRELH